MPAAVRNVAWKCSKCGKRKWLKPSETKGRRFCSRKCQYDAMRVEAPVRPVPSRKGSGFGERSCPVCDRTFPARNAFQTYCSQPCALQNAQDKRRKHVKVAERSCEQCQKVFAPRGDNAGRFCSRQCLYEHNRGANAVGWKGGRSVTQDGYVLVSVADHPYARKHHGYVPEHRLVMEQQLGRHLVKGETVHHINGNRGDNRLENLQLRTGNHGKGAAFECYDCGSSNVGPVKLKEST